jgi:hypothetical protein
MKTLKIFMTVIAYLGITLVILGTIMATWTSIYNLKYDSEWTGLPGLPAFLGILISIPGVLLALIGGLIARPRYIWFILIIVGIVYCIIIVIATSTLVVHLVTSIPGVICIIEGFIILYLGKKKPTISIKSTE